MAGTRGDFWADAPVFDRRGRQGPAGGRGQGTSRRVGTGRRRGREDRLGRAQGRRVPIGAGRFRAPAQVRSTVSNGQGLSEPACREGLPSLPPRTPFSAPEQHSSQPHTQGGSPQAGHHESDGTTSHPDGPEDARGKRAGSECCSQTPRWGQGHQRPPDGCCPPAGSPPLNREGPGGGERGFTKEPHCSFSLSQHLRAPYPCSLFPSAGRGISQSVCLSTPLCRCPQSCPKRGGSSPSGT